MASTTDMQQYNDYQYILAYLVFGAMLWIINRSKFGHNLIYYVLLIFCFYLVLVDSGFIVNALAPLGSSPSTVPTTPGYNVPGPVHVPL